MTITLEKFDYNKFQTEKVQFAIDLDREVFNVSEGTNSRHVDDELGMSHCGEASILLRNIAKSCGNRFSSINPGILLRD